MENLTNSQINSLNGINTNTIAMRFGEIFQELIIYTKGLTTVGTPVNAVNARIVLNAEGVVVHGETLTINNPEADGADVYEFLADAAQVPSDESHIPVNIAANAVKAFINLTVDIQPTSGDKMTIGTKVYTFVPVGTDTADGEISIGADLAEAQANIVAAINGTDGVNTPHPEVVIGAFALNVAIVTALIGGVAGNAIATTETFSAETNVFADDTLGSGADCVAANAITALVAAITASDTQGVGAADGTGDTVVFTADVAGVIGNAIAIAEDMGTGSFAGAAVALAGGINGTVGEVDETMIDASYIYRCVSANTISGKNWRRISLGEAY